MSQCHERFGAAIRKKRCCIMIIKHVSIDDIAAIAEFLKTYRDEQKKGEGFSKDRGAK